MATTLSDITEFIIDTKHNTPEYSNHGYPCIRTPNIGRGYFILENVKYVNENTYQIWTERAVPKTGDLILAREAPVGNVAWIPPRVKPCIGQRTVLIRPRIDSVDSRYLTFLLLGDECQNRMHSMSGGATVAHLNMSDIRTLELPELPPLPTQRKIAAILSAYDDLIENNLRRIKILEEMAQNLYREWFVKFRFPGHTHARFFDSALGRIPEGWKINALGEVVEIFRGRSYRSVDLADEGGLPFLNLKCIDRDGGFRRSGLKRYIGEYKDSHVAKQGDIVVAVTDMTQDRRIVARAALVPTLDRGLGICSLDLIRIEPKPPMPKSFLYSALRYSSFADEVKQHANGVNVLHLAPERITDFQFVVPPVDLMLVFANFVAPSLVQMDALENKNIILRHTRELLLPKLISGEVDVSELDITVPAEIDV